jgi:tRNA (guanine-N7-)-methyltransferase
MGKTITRLTVAKAKKFTIPRRTWGFDWSEEGMAMHVKTGKPLPEDGLSRVTRVSGEREGARWAFKNFYEGESAGHGKKFLVETVASDGEFEQHCYVKVVERGADTLVKLDGGTKVFLTPAVRFAVEDLARRLSEAADESGEPR